MVNELVFLDITSEVCPMTFVKTRLFIDRLDPGDLLSIRLNAGEPLENVPRAVREHGHEIVELKPEAADRPDGVHLLVIRKR